MKIEYLNFKENVYFIIRQICSILAFLPFKIGNWATDKLNESYYNVNKSR